MKKMAMKQHYVTETQRNTLIEMAKAGGYELVDLDVEGTADCHDAEALFGCFQPEELCQYPNLKWMQAPFAGVERWVKTVDGLSNVTLTSASGAFGQSIAEHCIMGILMLRRHAKAYLKQQEGKGWGRVAPMGFLAGSTVVVLGLGDIGSRVATICKAMGATVRGVKARPCAQPDYVDSLYLTDQLMEACSGADMIVASLPSAPGARGLVTGAHLKALNEGGLFLNVGRGDTVDEGALVEALQSHLGGALLDVMQIEPLPQESPLWGMENVILTPHVSGGSDDPFNRDIIFSIYRDNLRRFLAGEPLANVVDTTAGY